MRATIKYGLSLTLCTVLLASGCGLKGGLYLPDDPNRPKSESGNPDGSASGPTDERTDKERRRDTAGGATRDGSTPIAPQVEPPTATRVEPSGAPATTPAAGK